MELDQQGHQCLGTTIDGGSIGDGRSGWVQRGNQLGTQSGILDETGPLAGHETSGAVLLSHVIVLSDHPGGALDDPVGILDHSQTSITETHKPQNAIIKYHTSQAVSVMRPAHLPAQLGRE